MPVSSKSLNEMQYSTMNTKILDFLISKVDSEKKISKADTAVQSLGHVQLFATMDCSTPVFSVLNCLPEFAQTHVYWVGDAIQIDIRIKYYILAVQLLYLWKTALDDARMTELIPAPSLVKEPTGD